MISPQDELEKYLDRKGTLFSEALLNLVSSNYRSMERAQAMDELAALIQKTLQAADMHGRYRMLKEADAVKADHSVRFAEIPDNANPLGGLPFTEAIEDLIDREPRLAKGWEEVSRLYNTQKVFAMARSADQKITERVQKEVGELLSAGKTHHEVENAILNIGKSAEMGAVRNWTRAYSANVYRTNAATGYSNGRMEQAKDPEVAEVIPALRYSALHDARTRPHHFAADGLIAATTDPVWHRMRTPAGWQCRCSMDFVSRFELERMGLIHGDKVTPLYPPDFANAHPDPGFRLGAFDFVGI